MSYEAKVKRPEVILEAVVIRADGTREDLGVIARTSNGTIEVTKKSLMQKLKGLVNRNG